MLVYAFTQRLELEYKGEKMANKFEKKIWGRSLTPKILRPTGLKY
jgi:hypothetical protein